ncbi:MAG: hypothetical protein Q8P46_06865 [Hyphomicrobiales bacterium]|nr:hypothetical protein [Hyphomicrobiales bacterium]
MIAVLGIDPGVSGALACVDEHGVVQAMYDMPVLQAEGARGRRIVDGPALIRLLRRERVFFSACNFRAVLESVRSMPRDGHVGAFSFGRSFGTIETALAAVEVPFVPVRPQVWKKALSVPASKDGARAAASRLLPSGASMWPLKKHDGRAEAALIAYYGVRHVFPKI